MATISPIPEQSTLPVGPNDNVTEVYALWFFRRELAFRAFYLATLISILLLIGVSVSATIAANLQAWQGFITMMITTLYAHSGAYMGLATYADIKAGRAGGDSGGWVQSSYGLRSDEDQPPPPPPPPPVPAPASPLPPVTALPDSATRPDSP